MDVLIRLATPVRIDVPFLPSSSKRHAAVTFDDGFEDLRSTALPELSKRKIPCAIFAIAGALGKVPDWTGGRGGSGCEHRLMTAAQLRQTSSDLVLIGSHTVTHPRLPRIDAAEARREVFESRSMLETLIGRPIQMFSFPYGAFNEALLEVCREAGYERVFTTQPDCAFSESRSSFVTGRVPAEPTDWPLEFRLKLIGAYQWLPLAFSVKQKVLRLLRRPFGNRPCPYEPAVFR